MLADIGDVVHLFLFTKTRGLLMYMCDAVLHKLNQNSDSPKVLDK